MGNTVEQHSVLAAIDLGSNSFHMIVARIDHGELRPIERLGEKVQLAAGLQNGRLDEQAISRGLACLTQFRQVLDRVSPQAVRVVGTNALRAAKNYSDFTLPARAIVGSPVEVISGREEARLVYLGVAHTLADDEKSRLVVDIGGGSTEFVVGERFEARLLESLHMGCVSYRDQFFVNGKLSAKRFEAAYQAAYLEVLKIRKLFKKRGWEDVVGSSGTMRAIEQVLVSQGWSESGISRKGLEKLKKLLMNYERVEDLAAIAGLKEARQTVFTSGVAITLAIFDALKLDIVQTSPGALREGVIYDMLGRYSHEDVRERTVSAMMQRYQVDQQNATDVEKMALQLFDQAAADWELGREDRELLSRAARLHEIGLAISHSQFHKHGQYLVQHADMPGFSRSEQADLALLVRAHRQKFPGSLMIEMDGNQRNRIERLCILLRLANLFKYISEEDGIPELGCSVGDDLLQLDFPGGWLERHPLTRAELGAQQQYLEKTNYRLVFN